ncbi:MAG TPA: hypothetical protein VJK54_01465, partial [Chthoniobacterales bacterium]|nr:hypothetical protein [Chthoniobacterales bacterium]
TQAEKGKYPVQAEQAYNELLNIYKDYQEQVANYYPEHLVEVTQSRYNADYKEAETKRNYWRANVMKYNAQELQKNFTVKINAAKAQVEATTMVAFKIRTKTNVTVKTPSQQTIQLNHTSKELWDEVLKATEKSRQAYNELVEVYKNYKEQAQVYCPEYLDETILSQYDVDYQKAEAEKNRLDTETNEYVREREEWIKMQKKFQPEVEIKIREIRGRIALIERRIEETKETNRLAQEKVERVNNKFFVMDSTRVRAKEMAEKAKVDLEEASTERKIAEADLVQWQNVLTRLEKGPEENIIKLQEARLKIQTTTGISLSCWKEVITSLERSAEYWKKLSEVQSAQALLAVNYSLVATELEQAAEYSKKAAEAYGKAREEDKNWKEGNRWREAGKSTQISADCRIKGIEMRSQGKDARAQEYTAAAEKLKEAAISSTQAVLLLLEGKEKENSILLSQGNSFQSEGISRKYTLQELEAQEAGKATLAAGYREAAATTQRASEKYQLAVQAYVAGKDKEDDNWYWAGKSLQISADYQAKASEAQEAGKTQLAVGYREATATSQRASEQYELAVQTYAAVRESESKEKESGTFKGLKNWGHKSGGHSWGDGGKFLQAKADYQAKASEAQEAGKTELAVGYREAATTFQRAADQKKLAAQAYAAGKNSEGSSWAWEGTSLQSKADYQAKKAEAQEVGKNQLAADYLEAAATSQRAADQWKLSAQAIAAGKESEGDSCFRIGKSLQAMADYQAKACEAQDAGKATLAIGYREAVTTYQRAADQIKLLAQANSEYKHWSSLECSFSLKAIYQARAAEAQEAGKIHLAVGYREAATTSQRAADQHKQAVQADTARKEKESSSWLNEGFVLGDKARFQVKAAEAEESGKTQVAVDYKEVALTFQIAADQFKLAAQTYATGKESEGESWDSQGRYLKEKAAYQAKAAEAQEAGKTTLAAGYREVAIICQSAADQSKLAAQAYATRTKSEGESWSKASWILSVYKANDHKNAIEAQEAGKMTLAAGYREAVKTAQDAANQYKLAAQTKAVGKEIEGNSWDQAGESLRTKALCQAKASEAQEAGKTTLVAGYREAATTSQKAADQCKLSAQTKASGKESEGIYWAWEGTCLQLKAHYQAEASAAQEAGKTQLAACYRDATATYQRAADQFKQSAITSAAGKESESTSWYFEGNSLQLKAFYQLKAMQAQEARKTQLAASYQEAAAISQRAADQWKQSAIAYAAGGNSSEYTRLWQAGQATQVEADAIAKKAEEKG